jgi:hypothetical protein
MEQKPAIYPEEARELGLEEIPCKGVVFKDYEVASNTLNKQDAK